MNVLTKVIQKYPGTGQISLVYHLFTNVYVIESDTGLMVVDTGMRGNTWKILRAVRLMGHQPSDVSIIVLTHAHFDHFGSAPSLRARTGAPVAGHQADVPYFERGGFGFMPYMAQRRADFPAYFRKKIVGVNAVTIDRPLEDGEQLGEWRVIHTPGHTPGTISLYSEKRGVLITGGWAISSMRPELSRRHYQNPLVGFVSNDQAQMQASRLRLAQLDFQTLLCSHFPPRVFPFFAQQLRAIAG